MQSARPLDLIVIHCSATPNGRWTTVLDIDQWHRDAGFQRRPVLQVARAHNPELRHIGYHWVIYTNGGRATGRHPSEQGAHVAGHNARSFGLCMIGTDRFSPAQWHALADQVRHLCALYNIPLRAATADNWWTGVCGHRDTGARKLCPGFDVAAWLAADLQPRPENILTEAPTP